MVYHESWMLCHHPNPMSFLGKGMVLEGNGLEI